VENLRDFFERFRTLNVRSNQDLDELVEQAQQIVDGVEPQALRHQPTLREHISVQLTQVQASLDRLTIDRPRRNILRQAK
jgi:hypothetical protein